MRVGLLVFGSSATPTRCRSMAAAPSNWSVAKGITSSGTPCARASVTLLLPPWLTSRSAARSSATWGRLGRISQSAGTGPSASRGVAPMAMATRTRSCFSTAATRTSTSSRADRKVPKDTTTRGRPSPCASQAATSSSAVSSRAALPRKACAGSSAVRDDGCSSAGYTYSTSSPCAPKGSPNASQAGDSERRTASHVSPSRRLTRIARLRSSASAAASAGRAAGHVVGTP